MKLGDLTAPYTKCRVITYGRDHNTAVEKRAELQQIGGYLYRSESKRDSTNQPYCRFYLYYKELGIGMDIGRICYPDEHTVDEVIAALPPKYLNGPQALIDSLDMAVANEQRIFNAEIALARYLVPEKADAYVAARQRYLDKEAAEHAAKRTKREAENAAYCAEQNAKVHQEMENALHTIRNGGILKCPSVAIYRSRFDCLERNIVNYLAKQFGIMIPLKVQGWINQRLLQVVITDGQAVSLQYQGGRGSKTVFRYLNELIAAVLQHTPKEAHDEE